MSTPGPAASSIESARPSPASIHHRYALININAAERHQSQENGNSGLIGTYQLTKIDKLWIAILFFNVATIILQVIIYFMYPCDYPSYIKNLSFLFNACFAVCAGIQWHQTRNRIHPNRPLIN